MGGDSDCLHASLIFCARIIYLRKNNGKGDPLAGTYVLHSDVDLDDPALRLQPRISQIHQDSVGTSVYREVDRRRTLLWVNDNSTVYRDSRIREGDLISLRIGVGDGLIDLFGARCLGGVTDEELQSSTF